MGKKLYHIIKCAKEEHCDMKSKRSTLLQSKMAGGYVDHEVNRELCYLCFIRRRHPRTDRFYSDVAVCKCDETSVKCWC